MTFIRTWKYEVKRIVLQVLILMMVEDAVVPFFDQDVARTVEPDHLLEFGVGGDEGGPEEF